MKLDQITRIHRRSQITLTLFFGISLLLGLAGSFVKYDLMPNFREQRSLASFPLLEKIKSIHDLPSLITQFAADNFGFRKPLLSVYFKFRLHVLGADLNLPALLGQDGWLFVEGEAPSFRHQDMLNTVQAERIRNRLDAWCDYAHQRGAELVFFVGPNKSTIYPEKFPRYFEKFSNHPSMLDQVYALDFSCNFIKVDLRETLLKNREELLYYKWGTHWNDRGAQLAWNQIKEKVSVNIPNLNWPMIDSSSNKFRPARPGEDSMWPWFGQNDPELILLPSIELISSPKRMGQVYTQENSAKLLVFGDSFLQFMIPTVHIVANEYSAWVLRGGDKFNYQANDAGKDAWLIVAGDQRNIEIMDKLKPDLVMIEIVERSILSIADLPLPEASNTIANVTPNKAIALVIQVNDLVGYWKAGIGIGKFEGTDGSDLLVTTEANLKGAGKVTGDHIEVADWHMTGRLSADKKKIFWSNGFVWNRIPV